MFISTANLASGTLRAMCLDRLTGKVRWDNAVGEGKLNKDERSNFSSPSPVADAGRVFFFYGNGSLVAFDHAGKELWSRNLIKDYGDFAFYWTFSSSPTLFNGKLYLQVLQRNEPADGHGRTDGPIESYLLALDPATGKNLWRVIRPTDATFESFESYATPIPFQQDGKWQLLITGGDHLTAHDPETGRELWRTISFNAAHATNWRHVPSPVAGAGVVLECEPQRNPVYAIKPAGSGMLPRSAIAWDSAERREFSSDVPTPAFYDGDFIFLSDTPKTLLRIEPATGKIKWKLATPGRLSFQGSPTVADGRIYFMNFGGDVAVVDAAKGELIANIPMGEPGDDLTRSSISVADGELFIRTNHKLFCIAKK